MLVPKGASSDDIKERSLGMWVAGSGPVSANVVRLSAVMTAKGLSTTDGFSAGIKRTVQNDYFVRATVLSVYSHHMHCLTYAST